MEEKWWLTKVASPYIRFQGQNCIIKSKMGAGKSPKQPQPTMEDYQIEMKMNSKRMARESAKAQKESAAYMKKAKQALRKNNEEGAKLYLQSASSKRAESMNIQRMGLKMEFIGANMKTMQNNEQIMGSFQKMAQVAGYSNNMDFNKMADNMQNLEKCMDDMMINGKVMEELMQQNSGADTTADNMLDVLKGELAMQEENKINEAATIKQNQMAFQEDLKKL